MYMFITIEQNTNFKQNTQKNRLKIKELPERKIGEKKSKIGSSLRVATSCTGRNLEFLGLGNPKKCRG